MPKPWRVTDGPFARMTEDHLTAIGRRLNNGCPTEGLTISPWAAQLLADALNMYGHIQVMRADLETAEALIDSEEKPNDDTRDDKHPPA